MPLQAGPAPTIYLEAAQHIGRQLCRDAIWCEQSCNWLSYSGEEQADARLPVRPYARALQQDLYSGLSGVLFFLNALRRVIQEPWLKKIQAGALQALLKMTENPTGSGMYAGTAGTAYVLITAGREMDNPQALQRGLELLRALAQRPSSENRLDLIDGSAGEILILLRMHRDFPNEQFLDTAITLGRWLVEAAMPQTTGKAWVTIEGARPLTGLAHGAAGIAHALQELYQETHIPAFLEAAEQGFAYEAGCYDVEAGNWPDFRSDVPELGQGLAPGEKPYCATAWCHGAPGIGLTRLRAWELTGKQAYLDEANQALKTTLETQQFEMMPNICLCHGLTGNADLFIEAARILKDPKWMEPARTVADWLYQKRVGESAALLSGIQTDYDLPDLMLGWSGVGYFFLRMHDVERFPSILYGCNLKKTESWT